MNSRILMTVFIVGLLSWPAYRWISEGDPPLPVSIPPYAQITALKAQVGELEQQNRVAMERLAELERNFIAISYEALPVTEAPPASEAEEADTVVPVQKETVVDARRLRQIEEAGLTQGEFQAMEERAYELYLTSFEGEWLQRRERYLTEKRVSSAQERLREDLGDDAYDRYLYASGGSNRVRIREVMRGSAAEAAGLSDGDILLSYDGKRVFGFEDLRRSSYEGELDDTVVLEVRRADNSVSQMIIPRGPMGVSGYRGWSEPPG